MRRLSKTEARVPAETPLESATEMLVEFDVAALVAVDAAVDAEVALESDEEMAVELLVALDDATDAAVPAEVAALVTAENVAAAEVATDCAVLARVDADRFFESATEMLAELLTLLLSATEMFVLLLTDLLSAVEVDPDAAVAALVALDVAVEVAPDAAVAALVATDCAVLVFLLRIEPICPAPCGDVTQERPALRYENSGPATTHRLGAPPHGCAPNGLPTTTPPLTGRPNGPRVVVWTS